MSEIWVKVQCGEDWYIDNAGFVFDVYELGEYLEWDEFVAGLKDQHVFEVTRVDEIGNILGVEVKASKFTDGPFHPLKAYRDIETGEYKMGHELNYHEWSTVQDKPNLARMVLQRWKVITDE